MRARLASVVLAATAAVLACPGAGSASSDPANVPWETFLPALPSPNSPQPHAVPYCRTPRLRCIDTEVRRLRAAQKRLRCDHRAVFATTYLELTRTLRSTLRRDSRFFRYPRYLYTEDALFADVYFNTLRDYGRGRAIPPAWKIAFDTARSGAFQKSEAASEGTQATTSANWSSANALSSSVRSRMKRAASRAIP